MIYPKKEVVAKEALKAATVDGFMFGINDDTGIIGKKDDFLAECENMEYAGRRLKTRAGFRANADSVIGPLEYDEEIYLPFTVFDTVFTVEGKLIKPAYCCTGDTSSATLRVFTVDSGGNITPAGSITYQRVDSSTFYIPENVFFTVANAVSSTGVFMFVKRKSGGDTAHNIYEANGSFTEWLDCTASLYVPTVRINGRGENYELAHANLGFTFPEPKRPEELNLLCGKFKCYFTSDSLSSLFRLPYANLPDVSTLNCKVYSTPGAYTEWNVPPLENSASATVSGETITLYVDRTLGLLRFRKSDNTAYEIPHMFNCQLNNIAVVAQTADSEFAEAIMGTDGAVMLDNRIYYYGNKSRQNCIFCTRTTNPLYFPQSSKLFVGDGATAVTALRIQNGKLIAFKPGETYRIVTSFENETVESETVLPENTVYLKGDLLKAQTVDANIGCSLADTVCLCGNRLVWLADDGGVYALATTTYGNTTNVIRVSRAIGERIKDAAEGKSGLFAVAKDGQYMLFIDKTVFVMNARARGFGYPKAYYAADDELKSPAWYVWTLPDGISFLSGTTVDGNAVFVSQIGDEIYFYTSTLCEGCDRAIIRQNGENTETDFTVRAGFTTKYLDMGTVGKKRLDRIAFTGENAGSTEFFADTGKCKYSRRVAFSGDFTEKEIEGGIPSFYGIRVSMYDDRPFYLRNFTLLYKKLDKG